MAADPKSVSVEALKSSFKEGATPNEEDYHALIALAAVGGKALGGNDNIPTKLSPGMGLQMEEGQLAVKVKKDAGVTLDGDGVLVKGDDNTVTVTAAGVGIKVKANGGLETNAEGRLCRIKASSDNMLFFLMMLPVHVFDPTCLPAIALSRRYHRPVCALVRSMLGFKSFRWAQTLLAGIELLHMIRKGQYQHSQSEGLSPAEQFYLLAA